MCCVDRLNPQPFQDIPLDNLYTDSVLKRLLIICLVISTIGYGSVGAFDGHADEVNEHQGVVGYAGHSPDNDEDHPSCDHCCHASAHTMALSPFQSSAAYSGSCTGNTPYHNTLSFLSAAPPDRPPRN